MFRSMKTATKVVAGFGVMLAVAEQSAASSEDMASSSQELGAQSVALKEMVGTFKIG